MSNVVPIVGSAYHHKKITHVKTHYKILIANKLSKEQKEKLRAVAKLLTTGEEAERFIFQPGLDGKKGYELGWQFAWLDTAHTAGVLKKHGTEVALYYKRQVITEEPQPGDPIPEGWLREPADIWVRLDLFGRSAREANFYIKKKHESFDHEVRLLRQSVAAKDVQFDVLETNYNQLAQQLAALTKYKDQLFEKVAVLSKVLGLKKVKALMEEHQKEKERLAKKAARIEAKRQKNQKQLAAIAKKKALRAAKLIKKKGEARSKENRKFARRTTVPKQSRPKPKPKKVVKKKTNKKKKSRRP